MTARLNSKNSKLALATSLLMGTGLLTGTVALTPSSAAAQGAINSSVVVNYGALDRLEDAAPAARPVDPASYAKGNGYPFATGPQQGRVDAYGANNPYAKGPNPYGTAPTTPQAPAGYYPAPQQAGAPMASPAPAVQATQTYGADPAAQADGYNRIMIIGSPQMNDVARRTGRLPYSSGTQQYRSELAQQVGSGAKARPAPTGTTQMAGMGPGYGGTDAGFNSSFSYGNDAATTPSYGSPYFGEYNDTTDLPRRLAAHDRSERPAPTAGRTASAYHKSDDGLIRRVSAQSGTIGVSKALLSEAAQRPTGLPPLLVVKFKSKQEDLSAGDKDNLSPVIAKLEGKYNNFEVIGFASDDDDRVARKRSLDRVVAVRNFMISNGVSPDRIKVRARGAEKSRSGKLSDQVVIGGAK